MNDESDAVPALEEFKTRIAVLDAQYQSVQAAAATIPLKNAAVPELETLKQAYWLVASELHQAANTLRHLHAPAHHPPPVPMPAKPRLLVRLFRPRTKQRLDKQTPLPVVDPNTEQIQAYDALKAQVHRKAMDIGDLCKDWQQQYQEMLETEAWWSWNVNVKVTLQEYGMCPVCAEPILERTETCSACGSRLSFSSSTR